MKKEIIIRIYVKSEKCQKNAMKEAAMVNGVESVTLAGGDKNLLLVIGDGVDSSKLTKKLKKKVGTAEIVELRTVDTFEAAVGGKADMAMAARSPAYVHWPYQYQYGAAASPYAYHHHYYPSPMAAGSSYARVVALSHPANYSPLVERHDYYPMYRSTNSSGAGADHKAAQRRSGDSTTTTAYKAVPRRHGGSSSSCCIL